jgi:hypothetical protein
MITPPFGQKLPVRGGVAKVNWSMSRSLAQFIFHWCSLTVSPTCRLAMSLNRGGVMHDEDREAELSPPPLPPHLRTQMQWGYPPPAPSSPGVRRTELAFSLSMPASSHSGHGLSPTSPHPYVVWCPVVHCGCPRDPVKGREHDEKIRAREPPRQVQTN